MERSLVIPDFASLVQVHLSWGKDRAVTIGTLQEQLGVSRRAVEKAIESMRLEGVPVCTGSEGAWLSTDARELYAHAARLRSRAIHVLLGARALRATARRHEKVRQTTIWDAA
jgi:biotin operon repressor